MGIPEHLTYLLRKLYVAQEATARTWHETMDWFQIGKWVHQGCILSPCLFNLHAEYIMRNARLNEAQAGIKIAGRSINNVRYVDDTTWQETKGNWRASWWKWKRRVKKTDLKHNIHKMKVKASGPITSWQIDGETVETVTRLYFGGFPNHCRWQLRPWN